MTLSLPAGMTAPLYRPLPHNLTIYDGPSLLTGDRILAIVTAANSNRKIGQMVQIWMVPAISPIEAVRTGQDAAVCGDCKHRGNGRGGQRTCYVEWWRAVSNIWQGHIHAEKVTPEQAGRILDGLRLRIGAYGDPVAVPMTVWRPLLDTAHNWTAYCVVPETKVLTADLRWACAGDVRTGDKLMGFDEFPTSTKGRYWRSAVVRGATRICRPCYAVHLRDGSTLISSVDHPWLVNSRDRPRWVRTDALQPGSRIVRAIDRWGNPEHPWDAGYLAAAFDGEGSFGQGGPGRRGHVGHLNFSQRDNPMADTVCQALDLYGFGHSKYGNRPVPQHYVHGGVREVMRFLGQMRPARLLGKFDPSACGRFTAIDRVVVDRLSFVGEREVAAFETSTRTFIAEGFASHNTHQWRRPGAFDRYASWCMASVDSEAERREAAAMGWRTFRVRPVNGTVDAAAEFVCPHEATDGRVQCDTCGRCRGQKDGARSIVVTVHGTGAKWFGRTAP